jgi:Fe-S cluster assembly ATP-binding protein
MLKIQNLSVKVQKKSILNNLNLEIKAGETHLLMGPNGSGKSTLASALLGNPNYSPSPKSKVIFAHKKLFSLTPDQRSKLGLFISSQSPLLFEGLNTFQYLRQIYQIHNNESPLSLLDFRSHLNSLAKDLNLNPKLFDKNLNLNFSGGEAKKIELIQAILINPKFIVFDEIDSGLDSDSIKLVFEKIKKLQKTTTILIITHNPKIAKLIKFNNLHIMLNGQIVKSGDLKLINQIEEKGYESFLK